MSEVTKEKKASSRFEKDRIARLATVQIVYQSLFRNLPLNSVLREFQNYRLDTLDYPKQANRDLVAKLCHHLDEKNEMIEDLLKGSIKEGWSFERMDNVLVAILKVALAELSNTPLAAPAPVIISEYVDIAKGFFQGKEPAFVNQLLDDQARLMGHVMKK